MSRVISAFAAFAMMVGLSFPASALDPENTLYLDLKDGRVVIELLPDIAPKHVKRIKTLTREGFYDGIVFHRVIDGFMAQTGDPTGTGMGGSDYPDVRAEFSSEPFSRGVIGAARSQHPDSANSQFFIVFDDANLELAADHLIQNKFRASGQTCVCTNRVYVHRSVADAFTPKIVQRVAHLKVGDGMHDDTDIGPLINRAGFDKVQQHVQEAIAKGARCVAGGLPQEPLNNWGFFFPPTVLRNVSEESLCVREETFGPVLPIIVFDDEKEVIAAANGTEYGLAAYLFSGDDRKASRVIRALQFGHIGHNSGTGPTPEAPFGGMKQSGFGREGGLEGLMEFIEPQTEATTVTQPAVPKQ